MAIPFVIIAVIGGLLGCALRRRSRREVFWIGSGMMIAGMLIYLLSFWRIEWMFGVPGFFLAGHALFPLGLGIAGSSSFARKNARQVAPNR